jgi:hypothetical protein
VAIYETGNLQHLWTSMLGPIKKIHGKHPFLQHSEIVETEFGILPE